MALTLKQRRFIDYYLGATHGNASEAARLVGYAVPAQQGYENLRKPEIQREIDRIYAENLMSASEVLARLSDQGRGAGAYIEALTSNSAIVNVERLLKDGKAHIIKSVKFTAQGHQIIEFYDAQAALIQIGRHHRLFTDRVEAPLDERDRNAIESLDGKLARLFVESVPRAVPG